MILFFSADHSFSVWSIIKRFSFPFMQHFEKNLPESACLGLTTLPHACQCKLGMK